MKILKSSHPKNPNSDFLLLLTPLLRNTILTKMACYFLAEASSLLPRLSNITDTMKFTLFPSFLLLCTATLVAQYPTGEKIQPYPAPIKERILLQRFDCNPAGVAQWRALHQATITSLAGSLQVESNGHDPYILLPPIATPKAGTFEFRIRLKNRMTPQAEIFWATTQQPNFQAENAVRFEVMSDGKWYTYSVEFTTRDPLTRLRFDPGTSAGVAEIEWVELYEVIRGEVPENPTPWVDPNWIAKVTEWKTLSAGNIKVNFDAKGTGAVVFLNDKAVGEIYPLAYHNPLLPLGGVKHIPFLRESSNVTPLSGPLDLKFAFAEETFIVFNRPTGGMAFQIWKEGIDFVLTSEDVSVFGPVFRPYGEMQQAVLNGVEYLEKGEHSSSTADIETREHLRFAPSPMDVTWQFMSIVTDKAAFGLTWDDPNIQPIFATPDFIFGDPTKHHLGLYGKELSGTLKIAPPTNHETLTALDSLILWAFSKRGDGTRGGAPDLPKRLRSDEEQRLLNLAAFEKSIIVDPNGGGWRHAALAGANTQHFRPMHGSDFITSIWQLSGTLIKEWSLGHGGGHLPNPASFFLLGDADNFRTWKRNESKQIRDQQRPDGSFPYSGIYLRGHWEDTASGHCGNKLYQLLYTYQILGEPEALAAALKGLEFANKFSVPRGAQVWELSLHTPDIMGSSRMCMANVWAYEATGDKKFLDHARRWAITGLPFVYLWERTPLGGKDDPVMLYATTPVFGATNWSAPNWIGLPVQWCGLDYAEACFMLAKHDQTVNWQKIAEGILVTAERMQYAEGPSIGLLPDSYNLSSQTPLPFDINPSVLVQQRRRLQGKIPALDIALSADKKYRVVSPYKTQIDGNAATIEGVAGTTYQIIVNGKTVKSIESKGVDRVNLAE